MPLLLLHGLSGNEPEHWQTWVAREARSAGIEVLYPDLPRSEEPRLDDWLDAVWPLISPGQPWDGLDVLAHSLGCHLWAHAAARALRTRATVQASRVLLVAPPGEPEVRSDIPTFEPAGLTVGLRAVCPSTTVLLGENDPWLSDTEPVETSGLDLRVQAGGGHLNVEAGYGPWPAMARWVRGGEPPGRSLAGPVMDQ